MKTEEFDDAIKRKLESINPLVDEKEIDLVHRYTVVNRSSFSMLKSNRVFWVLMATGMLITGLVTWKLTSLNVLRQNPALVATKKANTPEITAKNPAAMTKTDTVYIPEYINKNSGTYTKTKGVINNVENNRTLFDQKPVSESNMNSTQIAYNDQNTNINQNPDAPVESNTNSKPSSAIDGKQSSNNSTNPAETQFANAAPGAKSASDLKSSDTVAAQNKESVSTDIAKKAPIHNYSDEHKKPITKVPMTWGFMAGFGGELANTQAGGGLFTRLLVNRFSLNVGLKWMSINEQHYNSDIAYDEANPGKSFWYYCPNLPSYSEISDIKFTYSLWQLPVAFEYDFPLAKGWAFSPSLGTDLDLSCTNVLEYTTSEGYGENNEVNQTKNYPTVIFNNLVLSLGGIKQWNHLALQASLFASQQIETAWYKGSNQTFYGGNLKLFYRF